MRNPFRTKPSIPPREKRELEQVKKRIDKLEPRVAVIETQLQIMRREV